MARGTGSLATVRIDAADTAVWPGSRVKLPIPQILHFAPMALPAAVICRRASFNDFTQHIVERTDEFRSRGVMAFLELFHFCVVATCTVIRRHNDGYLVAVMIERRGIALTRLMTRIAIHPALCMRARFPLLYDPRRGILVAVQTGFSLIADLRAGRECCAGKHQHIEKAGQTKAHGPSEAGSRSMERDSIPGKEKEQRPKSHGRERATSCLSRSRAHPSKLVASLAHSRRTAGARTRIG